MFTNWLSFGGFLVGFTGSVLALLVSYDYIYGNSFKGLDFLLILLVVLPAFFALVTSFISVPLILIAFVWTLPFTLYLWMASGSQWLAVSCLTYLFSAYLKFRGVKSSPFK
ncbi:hypothetical protein [Brevibacillus reuszeri]|uniref:hypothetical protein n=1 Tax=Brevibacillus reuszeri TaxID=54915 RepID=UPI000CCBD760|nr:hypothetical protein [Brevibacillus reuszeri]